MTDEEKKEILRNHLLNDKQVEDKELVEMAYNKLSYDAFVDYSINNFKLNCPGDRPIDCGNGVCVAIGEICPGTNS